MLEIPDIFFPTGVLQYKLKFQIFFWGALKRGKPVDKLFFFVLINSERFDLGRSLLHPGGGGGTLIFSRIRRLGPIFWGSKF